MGWVRFEFRRIVPNDRPFQLQTWREFLNRLKDYFSMMTITVEFVTYLDMREIKKVVITGN